MKFEKGEIAIFKPSGADCEIKSVPEHNNPYFHNNEYILSIDGDVNPCPLSDGGLWGVPECMLAKKKPQSIDWVKLCNLKVLEAV